MLKLDLGRVLAAVFIVAVLFAPATGQGKRAGQLPQGRGPRQPVPVFTRDVAFDVILGQPTQGSVVFSLLSYEADTNVAIAYSSENDKAPLRTDPIALKKGTPREFTVTGMRQDTFHSYRVLEGKSGSVFSEGSFHTQRRPGATFTFTVTADSHLDQNTDPSIYQQTLKTAAEERPDFHIDLGDTFMAEKHESREGATQQYLAQRFYLAHLGRSAPLFLALGNHDGENTRRARDGADGLAYWAKEMRNRYFPNPVASDFYSGNGAESLRDYYSWQWGDALFIVLDPYWYGTGRREDERWGLSLGDAQYRWLKKTLESSKARYKFVFIHQLIGGADEQGRGGVEASSFGEWGGNNADGTEGFKQHRSGWELPIHRLLVQNHVSAVFHGHDHLFAKQDLDGIVYQEVPQPGQPGEGASRSASEYGYKTGTIIGGSGHLKITVSPANVTVSFIRTIGGGRTDAASFTYMISPGK